RPGLRRAPPRPAGRPHRRGPAGRRRLDPLPGPARARYRTRKRKRRKTRMTSLSDLGVKIFADGADRGCMRDVCRNPLIKGFATTPTLMRHAGIADYEAFARDILRAIPDRPISLEVFSDEFAEMEAQARRIASWGEAVYVKIPVTNTQGESAL